jgi:gas vesicle protein
MAFERDYDRSANAGLAFGLGMVAGAMIGVGLGLLFAPKDGAALRRDLAKRARELQEDAAGWYEEAASAASDLAEKGKEAAQRARTSMSDRV